MKKIFATFQLSLIVLLLTVSFEIALAQTQALPTLSIIGTPTAANLPITNEPPPQPTPRPTQQATQQTSGAEGTNNPNETTTLADLPQAEMPILDVTQETQTTEQCINSSPTQCMSPEQAKAAITPSLTSNQIKIALLVFLGGTVGGVSWLLSNFAINNAILRREEARFARQTRLRNTNRQVSHIRTSYNKITNSLADIMKSQTNGKITFTKDALKSFNEAIVEVEMSGSQKSVDTSRQLSNLISNTQVVSIEEFNKARNDLITSLKKDLGLKS